MWSIYYCFKEIKKKDKIQNIVKNGYFNRINSPNHIFPRYLCKFVQSFIEIKAKPDHKVYILNKSWQQGETT